jgi:AraC-like DNA-binding protein
MENFYPKAGVAGLGLILFSLCIIFFGTEAASLHASLIPLKSDKFLLQSKIVPEKPQGKTRLQVKKEGEAIEYEFFLDSAQQFPYAHYARYFVDANQIMRQVDLTDYQKVSFTISCSSKNVLMFVVFSADDKVTRGKDISTSRVSAAAFSCTHNESEVSLDLNSLITPDWWLSQHGYDYADIHYRHDKVMGFAWVTTFQSPVDVKSKVTLKAVRLSGFQPAYLYAAIAICFCLWVTFFVWLFRRYVNFLAAKITPDFTKGNYPTQSESDGVNADFNPAGLVQTYSKQFIVEKNSASDTAVGHVKKIAMERMREKEKISILNYMETQFTKPELSLEMATTSLGINRNKINDILREEVGVTFSAYLNRLRLTEAARLLGEGKINISEIAYSVGYSNVSYFNKLFKEEFGCAPTQYKSAFQSSPLHVDSH